MTGRVQTLRSNVAGNRPTGRAPGELYINWADAQFGSITGGGASQDLVAVRFFSTTANYAVGDFVIHGGQLYRAAIASPAGPFLPASWEQIAGSAEFLPLAGGTMMGSLILKADPGALLEAATKQYVDTKAGLYLPLAGGVLTGSLTGVSATFSGAVATGVLTVNGAATFAGNPVKISLPAGAAFANSPTLDAPVGTVRALFGSTNGSPRWRVVLGNNVAESGANAGADFGIASHDDSGAPLVSPFTINRANSFVNGETSERRCRRATRCRNPAAAPLSANVLPSTTRQRGEPLVDPNNARTVPTGASSVGLLANAARPGG